MKTKRERRAECVKFTYPKITYIRISYNELINIFQIFKKVNQIYKKLLHFFTKRGIINVYKIFGKEKCVADVSKQLFNWTDTYVIDVRNPEDALCALMLVLAIDAEKCSRN